MTERVRAEAPWPLAGKLWAATHILAGLRHDSALIDRLLAGVLDMEESSTYQAILARGEQRGLLAGRLAEIRSAVRRLGTKRFGPPDAAAVARLDGLADLPALEDIHDRILDASGWDDLFAVP